MDKLDIKSYKLLKNLYKANKHKKHFIRKYCRERDSLLEKRLIDCATDIDEELNNFIDQPKYESVDDIAKHIFTPAPYCVNDKGIKYYYIHNSERCKNILY